MNVHEWIAAASPAAPPALLARVRELAHARPVDRPDGLAQALADVGQVLLAEVLREGRQPARGAAIDLLAADACVTWSFEVAADDVGQLPTHARAEMRRIAQAVA